MKNHCSCCELGKNGNGCSVGKDGATVDRLSNLPEPILHHILSFVDDTKSVVQTSILSRSWNRVWKHVPVLCLNLFSFEEYQSFQLFVNMVLDLRYPLSLRKLSYMENYDKDKYTSGEESNALLTDFRDAAVCREVIRYGLSHDTRHLLIDLDNGYKDVTESDKFTDLFGTVSKCSIETLELKYVCINDGLGSCGFGMLTTLRLERCSLASDQYEDFFSNFLSLKDLVLIVCEPWDYDNSAEDDRGLKISAPQLLSLRLDFMVCYKMEVSAPRLKFFSLQHDLGSLESIKLSIPSLEHADLRVEDGGNVMEDSQECGEERFISLFQGLNSATYLSLDYFTLQALSQISEFLEQQQSSPFTRLKNLVVETFDGDGVPDAVINYFLKGSSTLNPNVERVMPCEESLSLAC